MDDDTRKVLARLDHEGAHALELAALYARTLESVARRMQSAAAARPPADTAALRSPLPMMFLHPGWSTPQAKGLLSSFR